MPKVIDLLVMINELEKEIGKLNYSLRFGNYGEQIRQVMLKKKERKFKQLELLKEIHKLETEDYTKLGVK